MSFIEALIVYYWNTTPPGSTRTTSVSLIMRPLSLSLLCSLRRRLMKKNHRISYDTKRIIIFLFQSTRYTRDVSIFEADIWSFFIFNRDTKWSEEQKPFVFLWSEKDLQRNRMMTPCVTMYVTPIYWWKREWMRRENSATKTTAW